MFDLKFNEEYSQFEGQFQGTVVSLGTVIQENKNGTQYVVGAVQFVDANGQLIERKAICYKKNLDKGIKVGESYLCNVVITENRPDDPIISISALNSAVKATAADFDFIFENELVLQGVGAEQVI